MDLKHALGLDTRKERYAFVVDPASGYISAQRAADHWVSTTCGYCSVGCGMLLGVKDGHAVSVRGNPDHPVNHGLLCPKGLSEHYTLEAPNRARTPLRRRGSALESVTWTVAIQTLVDQCRLVQAAHGAGAVGVISTGQLVTEEFYALGKLVQLGLGTSNFDGMSLVSTYETDWGY